VQVRKRYRAFISYSHADAAWARWLLRRLESYRVPSRLVGSVGHDGPIGPRLGAFFRDRDELSSAGDLGATIRAALAESDALLLICSPAAARSPWVNAEVAAFRAGDRGGRILCLIVAGDPGATDPELACFPPALLAPADHGTPIEPLAADARRAGDGRSRAFLKLVAGLLGIGFDDLAQREAQRHYRRMLAVATAALAGMAIAVSLAVSAHLARNEAQLRQAQAESLLNFMLGDLRHKLEPIGKLDLLDAVGDQALGYFAVLGDRGSPKEVLARAMALRQIGEVRFNQGHLEPALAAFAQSREISEQLHAQVPADNDSLFELGQAEFWVGYVAWQRNDLDAAAQALERYMQHSRELQARAPEHPEYRRELGYAYSNLGSIARERGQASVALDYFNQNQTILRDLLARDPGDVGLQFDLSESLSWIGSSLLDLGRLHEGEQAFQETYDLLARLHAADPNPRFSSRYSEGGRLLGLTRLSQGALADASRLAAASTAINRELVAHDPANADWKRALYASLGFQGEVALAAGAHATAAPLLAEAIAGMSGLSTAESGDADYLSLLARAESNQVLSWLDAGNVTAALSLANRAHGRLAALDVDKGRSSTRLGAVTVAEMLGRVQARAGRVELARATWSAALQLLGEPHSANISERALRMQLSAHLGQTAAALALADGLRAAGFADPRFPFPPSPP